MSVKIASWNVNGIRAASRNGFLKWFEEEAADVVCVQEVKANPDQLDLFLMNPLGYQSFWNPANKAGYSGVGIYSKKEPLHVHNGLDAPEFDCEGRVITAEYPEFVLINAYFPNSQRDHARLSYKLAFCEKMHQYCDELKKKGKPVILCGDFNIAHHEIDLKNPKQNQDNAGFLPEERAWMTHFLDSGYVDAFRHFNKGEGHYTWWSYRPGVRERNIGWRLDYFTINQEFTDAMSRTYHRPEVKGSDHCPVIFELR